MMSQPFQKSILFGLIMALAVCSSFSLITKTVLEQRLAVPTIPEVVVTTLVFTLEPSYEGALPHYHSGPVVGYVLKGSFLFQVNDEPPRIIQAGGAFYEGDRDTHMWCANASDNSTCEVLATIYGRPEEPLITFVKDVKRKSRAEALAQAVSDSQITKLL